MGRGVERARLGAAARALVEANRGAKEKTLEVFAELLPPVGDRSVVRPFRRDTRASSETTTASSPGSDVVRSFRRDTGTVVP